MTDKEYESGIATIIKDFRRKELAYPLDSAHVHRWVMQFEPEDRSAILKETFFVLSKYYIKEHEIDCFLKKILHNCGDLSQFVFMKVQKDGDSQKLLYSKINDFSDGKAQFYSSSEDKIYLNSQYKFVYIDDGLFTGKRARNDLEKVIDLLPQQSTLYVLYLFSFSNGVDFVKKNVAEQAKRKNISIRLCSEHRFKNKRNIRNAQIDIIWPKADEFQHLQNVMDYFDDIKNRMESRGKHAYYVFNQNNTECTLFENKTSGSILERAFTEKGVEIYDRLTCPRWQPLGKEHRDSLGFGAFIATDLNVPNNAPLVLWWGSVNPEDSWGWYPLLPRRGNKEAYEEAANFSEKYALKNYVEVLKEIMKITRSLAIEKEKQYLRKHQDEESLPLGQKIDKIWAEIVDNRGRDSLENYLQKQDFDTIKIIQAVMYIGRDYYPEDIADLPVKDPDKLVKEWLIDLGEGIGWQSKDIETSQIIQKLLTGRYLDRAFKILGIGE